MSVPAVAGIDNEAGSPPVVGPDSGREGVWAHDPSKTAATSDRAVPKSLEERVMFMVLAHPSEERAGVQGITPIAQSIAPIPEFLV